MTPTDDIEKMSLKDIENTSDDRFTVAKSIADSITLVGVDEPLRHRANTIPISQLYELLKGSDFRLEMKLKVLECVREMQNVELRARNREKIRYLEESLAKEREVSKLATEKAGEASARANAVDQLRLTEAKYEKAQMMGLRIKGICNARTMMESIQDDIIESNPKLRNTAHPHEVWKTLFEAKKNILEVAIKLENENISSADEAAKAVTQIYGRLSKEIHGKCAADAYISKGDYVCIPLSVLTVDQAALISEIANSFRFPVRTMDREGRFL